MECREVRQLAEAFVSEQLLVETTQAVVAHLERRCPACHAEIDGLRRLRAATRTAFDRAPDLAVRPEFRMTLVARLQIDTAHATRPDSRRRTWTWLAIAASVILVVGVGLGLRAWSAVSLTELLHAAVGDHQNCALAFALNEPPIPLAEAARRYGGIYEPLETVEPSRTTLSGGPIQIVARHSCLFDGQRFAHLVLRYKNETVSLLVADDEWGGMMPWGNGPPADGTIVHMPASTGFQIASFRDPRHAVFVISTLNERDVQDVAQTMVGPVSQVLTGAS